uniref:Uncharacterized protein n=1 Tax=Anguilla anguilla TaxID=7936 RepID=A0A0E9XR67_ANGAN
MVVSREQVILRLQINKRDIFVYIMFVNIIVVFSCCNTVIIHVYKMKYLLLVRMKP